MRLFAARSIAKSGHSCGRKVCGQKVNFPKHAMLLTSSSGGPNSPLNEYDFEVLKEERVHKRYLTLFNRTIKFPSVNGRPAAVHEYDVVGHPQCNFNFTVVFPFHSDARSEGGGQVTLLREHCQGPNQMMFVLPTGGFDPRRHLSQLDCAQAELSEEAQLSGGEWQSLLDADHPGIAEVKWCANRFTPFLCVNPEADKKPGSRDPEEFIEIHRLSLGDLRRVMVSGEMLLPSVTTCFLALERLKCLGILKP